MNLRHKIISNDPEFESFRESVKQAGLPHQDLNYNNQVLISYFNKETPVGTGGLEVLDRYALMRSISVAPEFRNQNIGKQIASDIIKNAKESNLEAVYLLTETAKDYFQKLGFETVNRDHVPSEIKSTTEFAHVCPTSATCMVLRLR